MKKKGFIKLVGLLAVLIFMVISISFTSIERKHLTNSSFKVDFVDDYRFITESEVEKIVTSVLSNLQGSLIDTLNAEAVELKVQEHPWVRKAEVFKGFGRDDSMKYTGAVRVQITQELPLFRVLNGTDGYYVNARGKKLPMSTLSAMHLPIVSGTVDDNFLQTKLLDFVKYIDENVFWKALIQQIVVSANQELKLVPRVGDHIINFGTVENMEAKFRNLKAVYKKGFAADDFEKYSEIKLAYHNQVVCVRK